jgi:hypothetical protein
MTRATPTRTSQDAPGLTEVNRVDYPSIKSASDVLRAACKASGKAMNISMVLAALHSNSPSMHRWAHEVAQAAGVDVSGWRAAWGLSEVE